METVRKPIIRVLYNNRNITKDISKYLLSLVYTDKDEKESDELELNIEDVDGLWRNSWYPQKGDQISASIGYDTDGLLLNCGVFEIDEITLSGPPDTISIKSLGAGIKKSFRTKISKSFENQTLKQIAKFIADKNGLKLSGTIANVKFERVTQYRETDLSFLQKIASEYGYLFSVRGTNLIFTSVYDIENGKAVVEIDRSQIKSYNLKDKTSETYTQATTKYHNPGDKTVNSATVKTLENQDGVSYKQISTGDTLEVRSKAETPAQAEAKSRAALHKKNSEQQTGSASLEGNGLLVAGNRFMFTGMGTLSGKYYIKSSRHSVTRSSGYTTDIEIKRIKLTTDSNKSKKQISQKPKYEVVNLTNKDGVSYKQIQ